jgi:hypothetical protein
LQQSAGSSGASQMALGSNEQLPLSIPQNQISVGSDFQVTVTLLNLRAAIPDMP